MGAYVGLMEMYVRMVDGVQRGPGDNLSLGVILYAANDVSIVRYLALHEMRNSSPANTDWFCPSKTNSGQNWEEEGCGWLNERK